MKICRIARLAGVAAVFVALLPAPFASADPPDDPTEVVADEPDYVAGRAIVGATSRRDSDVTEQSIEAEGGDVLSYTADGKYFLVDTPRDALEWAEDVEGDANVRYAEPDYELSIETEPDDPRWVDDTLWGLEKIDAPNAWSHETGSADVVVGVIDTGIDYTHPDLASQMWTNTAEAEGESGVDDDNNGWVDDIHGADCRNNDGDPMDDNHHGTHVAGTIGAAGNNGIGVAGVNWDVSLMALKFLSSGGSGATSDAIECLDYATEQGVDLTSNSWGGGSFSQAMSDAINRARQDDQLFIAAAGNGSRNTDSLPSYPAGYALDNVISVAATGTSDGLASFSNYGVKSVDLAAPGVDIVSTVPGGGYESLSGTSMATPHVAGAAALLIAHEPDLADDSDALRDRLYAGVDKVPGLATKVATGGRLNVARSLEPPPEVTSLVPAGSVLGDVLVEATTSTDDEPIVQVDFFLDDDASPLATDIDGSDGWNTLWATTSVADGHHELTAVATDSVGDTGSRSVDVSPNNVDEAPSVSVSSPVAGAAVRGTVPVVASASDDEAVTKVEFFVGATSLGIDTVGSNGWSVSWNTLTLPEGNRSLTAVATDSIAQTTTSNAVVVRIDNVRTMHVHDLDTTSAIVSSSTWKAALTITVFDEAEKGVGRASVKVAWSGGRTGSVSCTTAANGLCTISLTKLSRSSVASITATVTGVSVRTGFTYDSSDNHNPDSDTSNGTSITINRP